MMRHSLYSVKWYFSLINLNTKIGKEANKKNILKYYKWYTEEKKKSYIQRHLKLTLKDNPMRALVTIELHVVPFVLTQRSWG